MAFIVTSEFNGDTALMNLTGSLDASSASALSAEVNKAVVAKCQRLVLQVSSLDYMASAGLRVILFAKQKMGSQTDIYVVGAQETIKDTLERSGFDQAVIIMDSYDPAQV